jgi:hypothetical protein
MSFIWVDNKECHKLREFPEFKRNINRYRVKSFYFDTKLTNE